MRLFIDTGALAALSRRDDAHHRRATEFFAGLPSGTRLATSSLVFAETMTLLAARFGQDAALRFGESFVGTRILRDYYYSNETLERSALIVIRRFRDKKLSFVDAASIALVKAEGLDGIFGFDQDFARCGIPLYPRP